MGFYATAFPLAPQGSVDRCTVHAAGRRLEIGAGRVLVDDSIRMVSPAGLAVLRVLAEHRGNVVARGELLRVLPGHSSDTHAVEAAVARLRIALGDKRIIATVVKRGYRLAIDECPDAVCGIVFPDQDRRACAMACSAAC